MWSAVVHKVLFPYLFVCIHKYDLPQTYLVVNCSFSPTEHTQRNILLPEVSNGSTTSPLNQSQCATTITSIRKIFTSTIVTSANAASAPALTMIPHLALLNRRLKKNNFQLIQRFRFYACGFCVNFLLAGCSLISILLHQCLLIGFPLSASVFQRELAQLTDQVRVQYVLSY